MHNYRVMLPNLLRAMFAVALFCVTVSAAVAQSDKPKVPINLDNYVRAETDASFVKYVRQGALGKFVHDRKGVDVANQPIIRMNRDTPYSIVILDMTSPATFTKPDTGSRFQSAVVFNEDHYIKKVIYQPGTYTFTQKDIGTRYALILVRTFVDPNSAEDWAKVHKIQDATTVTQESPGTFEIPNWDAEQITKVRTALLQGAVYMPDSRGAFGDVKEVDPIRHLFGTAGGIFGNPAKDALYLNTTVPNNDGRTPYVLNLKDVPVDGFWSITVYDKAGFMFENPEKAYSVNNVTAQRNADGSVTVHFGGDPSKPNFLAIKEGWNYIVRLYRPRKEILDGKYKFPAAVPAP